MKCAHVETVEVSIARGWGGEACQDVDERCLSIVLPALYVHVKRKERMGSSPGSEEGVARPVRMWISVVLPAPCVKWEKEILLVSASHFSAHVKTIEIGVAISRGGKSCQDVDEGGLASTACKKREVA